MNKVNSQNALSDKHYLEKYKQLLEQKLQWGKIQEWTHRDFQNLSDLLTTQVGDRISTNTLKRALGKLDYKGSPYQHTLDSLAMFLDYRNWLDFKMNHQEITPIKKVVTDTRKDIIPAAHPKVTHNIRYKKALTFFLVSIIFALIGYFVVQKYYQATIPNEKYLLTASDTLLQKPYKIDLAVLIPSDTNITNVLSLGDGQRYVILSNYGAINRVKHTFKEAGIYRVKIFANNQTVATLPILAASSGWECKVEKNKELIYYSPAFSFSGKSTALPDSIRSNLGLDNLNTDYWVHYSLYKDLRIDGNNFTMMAKIRNPKLVQRPNFNGNIFIKLKGTYETYCVHLAYPNNSTDIYNQYSDVVIDRKDEQLKYFAKDISYWREIKLVVANKNVKLYLDKSLIYETKYENDVGILKGISIQSRRNGEVDWLKFYDGEGNLAFADDF